MSLTLLFLAAFTVACAIAVLVRMSRVRERSTVGPTEHQLCLIQPQDVHELLSISSVEQICARSVPNERLVRAFKITNTFVPTVSTCTPRSLVKHARFFAMLVRNQATEHVKAAIDAYISYIQVHPSSEYEPFIQYVSFTVILTTLFSVDTQPSPRDVLTVTQGINQLWRLSKTTGEISPHLLATINAHLRAWIPAYPNPLDFVLPTFETMWRVVAVAVAHVHQDPDALKAFARFAASPTSNQFECFEGDLPSVGAVIAETMRLHPPTRRIHRASVLAQTSGSTSWIAKFTSFIFSNARQTPLPSRVVADIGAIHRDTAIWGHDAGVFRPARHHPVTLTPAQRGAFMPFGYGRLKCVASSWAPHAAGLIVGEILNGLDESYTLCEGGQIGGRDGWEGWTVDFAADDGDC
ncbi:hypothetical protein EIP86_002018 [Pleurotus ostreatoroseus]|nr:hypothetical protein EIP86_002018 [Pleurotus ostreatoroseus]